MVHVKFPRSVLLLALFGGVLFLAPLGWLGLGPVSTGAETKDDKPSGEITPPPEDVNDLSMEVAALRTMYLFKTGPDQTEREFANYNGIRDLAKDAAQPARQRQAADVSKNYRKVLIDLRAAFVANQVDRINELSDQLDELAMAEKPDLDDAVEITAAARKNAPRLLTWSDANRVAGYIAAYGKDFPDPWMLVFKTIRGDGKGKKPTPEEWKETRDFVIKEVSWQFGGLDLDRQKKVGAQIAELLDRAYTLSDEQLKKDFEFKGGPGGWRITLATIRDQAGGPTDVIKHVIEQDLAELLSNPRTLAAIAAREKYLKTKR